MKQILKHGNKLRKVTCPYCECEITFDDEDIIEPSDWWTESFEEWLSCPECKRNFELRRSNI